MTGPIHPFSDVLIVDDSKAVRAVVRKIFGQLGFKRLEEASDGENALEKILERPFNLVISDWQMDPMSGQQLLERIRADKNRADLPFIMMSADSTIDKIVKAKRAGVTCYIRKPFGVEELRGKILQINTRQRVAALAPV